VSTPDLTAEMARTALAVSAAELSPAGRGVVTAAILDCLACAVAGSASDAGQIATDWLRNTGGRPLATVIGSDLKVAPAHAAWANAIAGHALDYDDVSVRMTHPSVTIVPGIWAIAECRGLPGTSVVDAYLAGFEIESRLCKVLNPDHYEAGWHTTGTLGVFGATAGAARILGLDLNATRTAFGIAASSSAGIRRNAGSMVKPLHAGHASFHGVQAAELAGVGFTASPSAMTGSSSFLDVFVDADHDCTAELLEAFAPDAGYELDEGGIAFKRFTCCGAIHTAIDALLELVAEHQIIVDDVSRITVRVNRLVPNVLTHHVTRNPLEGKFSLEYSLAVALADGDAGLEQYTYQRAADEALVALMERVDVIVDESIPVNLAFFPSDVTIERRRGATVNKRVDVARGYPSRPLTRDQLERKVQGCCRNLLDDAGIEELTQGVLGLGSCPDVTPLARLLGRPPI
jgi:2-methylcitrate dehydratase PrpD